MTEPAKLHANEAIKEKSRGLRGSLAAELKSGESGLSADGQQLIKFHGLYQQYDREKIGPVKDRAHTFMLRGRIPGGRLSAAQYLMWDGLADEFGGQTLRLTTRQSLQLYGLLKGDLKRVIQRIWDHALSTQGACGDIVRNVTQAANPWGRPDLAQLDPVAARLSNHFIAKSAAYLETWIDGEPVTPPNQVEADPIYGKTYLPRKFKIAVTLAGNNSVDLYTNDLAFAATLAGDGRIGGYHVFVGGGLGTTHNKPETFPRKADHLGWIPANHLLPVAEAVVTAHRDFGDRSDRKHARLKYVLHEKGVDWFRSEVSQRAHVFFEPRLLPPWNTPSYLGWQKMVNGNLALGFHLLSGRLRDEKGRPLKSAVAHLVREFRLPVQLTSDQDLIFLDIPPHRKGEIETYLAARGLSPDAPTKVHERAMACPALPTCSLAITEAERFLPKFLSEVDALLAKHGLQDRAPVLRMTGCPNGCARPYTAEIGLVGQQAGGKYALYVGGDHEGTRLAFPLADKLPLDEIKRMLDGLFAAWKSEGAEQERFGSYAARLSAEALRAKLSIANS
ncbi:MAG: NADPH-dependent assimilatory sulfite reductase hemoprotein subunit [Spirochaetes bacterium]|nr:NADPH-dependent assimilatory sulfite reductase hemoprotein subunit [Spirochaetota bacterium]